MADIDFSEVLKGFTGAAQAVGSLRTLQRDFKYGDREAEANIQAKELGVQKAQMEINEANRLQQQREFDKQITNQVYNLNQLKQEISQSKTTGAPLSDKASATAIQNIGQNAYVSNLLINGDLNGVREFTKTVNNSVKVLDDYFKKGSISKEQEDSLKNDYVKLNKIANKTDLDPKNIQFIPDEKGQHDVYYVDPSTGTKTLIDKDPVKTIQNMSVQSNIIDTYLDDLTRKNLTNVSPEMRSYLMNMQSAKKLAAMLPANSQEAVMLRVTMSSPEQLNTALPKLFDKVESHLQSTRTSSILAAIKNIPVVGEIRGKPPKGKTLGEVLTTNQDPTVTRKALYNILKSIDTDPNFASLKRDIADNGITMEQLETLITDPYLKKIKEDTGIKSTQANIEESKAKTNYYNTSNTPSKNENSIVNQLIKIDKIIASLDAKKRFATPEERIEIDKTIAFYKEQKNQLTKNTSVGKRQAAEQAANPANPDRNVPAIGQPPLPTSSETTTLLPTGSQKKGKPQAAVDVRQNFKAPVISQREKDAQIKAIQNREKLTKEQATARWEQLINQRTPPKQAGFQSTNTSFR